MVASIVHWTGMQQTESKMVAERQQQLTNGAHQAKTNQPQHPEDGVRFDDNRFSGMRDSFRHACDGLCIVRGRG